MGQGKIPNAILKCLGDKKDLGIHTEVFSDNLLPLIEKGVINGARKSINKGKIISTFIQGTRALYEPRAEHALPANIQLAAPPLLRALGKPQRHYARQHGGHQLRH